MNAVSLQDVINKYIKKKITAHTNFRSLLKRYVHTRYLLKEI